MALQHRDPPDLVVVGNRAVAPQHMRPQIGPTTLAC